MSSNSVGNRDYKSKCFPAFITRFITDQNGPNWTPLTRHLDLVLRDNIYVINPFRYCVFLRRESGADLGKMLTDLLQNECRMRKLLGVTGACSPEIFSILTT